MTAGRPSTGVLLGAAGLLPVGLADGGVPSEPAGRGRGRGVPAGAASDLGSVVSLPTAGSGRTVLSFGATGATVFGRLSIPVVFPAGAAVARLDATGLADNAVAL